MNRGITFGIAWLATISMGFSAFAQDSIPTSVVFKKVRRGVGDIRHKTEAMGMKNELKITEKGQVLQTINQKVAKNKESKIEVLAVDKDEVTKIKVTCRKKEEKSDVGKGRQDKKSPLTGMTFILEKKDDKVIVTDGAGKKLKTQFIEDEARAAYTKALGPDKSKFQIVIPDRPIKIGETIDIPKKVANKFFEDDEANEKTTVEKFTLTLKSTKKFPMFLGDNNGPLVAVFDMAVKFVGEPQKGMKVTMDMKGVAVIGINNCWTYLIDIKGPMTMTGSQQNGKRKFDLAGRGLMGMKKSAVYSKAKPTTGAPKKP
jgi:hypothetical protein